VLVHDGARPLVSERLIVDGLAAARETGAAIAAVRPKDTMKQLRGDGRIGRTLNRERLVAVQTPQVFRRALLADAHDKIIRDVTDDAAMVERIGAEVIVYEGDYANIKVTTPEDLAVAQALLAGAEATGD
jgi:2-C-methyl-D-erythritol 4-phosphate cytidylyltransferase